MQNPNNSETQNPDQPRNTTEESPDQSAFAPTTEQLPTPTSWPYAPWFPVQGPWVAGPNQQWASYNPNAEPESNSGGSGMNPYPSFPPGFAPLVLPPIPGRPEPGDALYTSSADGPELRLITLQLTGSDHYSAWARDFRRALVTKDKDGFLDGSVPFPIDERLFVPRF